MTQGNNRVTLGTAPRTDHDRWQRKSSGVGPAAAISAGRGFEEPLGLAGDAVEREADRVAETVVGRGMLRAGGTDWAAASNTGVGRLRDLPDWGQHETETIRRAPRDASAPEALTLPDRPHGPAESDPSLVVDGGDLDPDEQGTGQENAAPAEGMAALLVEDDSDTGRGQMRRSAFLAAVRTATCAAVDGALSGTGRDSAGCPWIDHWIHYYAGLSAFHVERALLRYAPEARGMTAAADYIPVVAARVRRSAETFAGTGKIVGVPDDVPSGMPGGGVLAPFGGMFFKARPGGPRHADPIAVRRQLGHGESLPGSVRAPMESAFGASFSSVRFHNDGTAARLSDRLNARAFTVGQHVAFGRGEFRPGTLVGDALIAHELAHVLQQGGGHSAREQQGDATALEQDADRSAEGAMRSSLGMPARVSGRLRTGLRLQRCSRDQPQPASRDPQLLQDFAAKFSEAAAKIRSSPDAMRLVAEAVAAGVQFGGFAEDGPGHDPWAYTIGTTVYVPRARTDPVLAMSDFLFELNNAIRAPAFRRLDTEAARGSAGTLTARAFARRVIEEEVEGMLRLGEIWFEMRRTLPEEERNRYDADFYQSEYNDFRAGRKTKDDIVNDVLQRVYTSGVDRGKTHEQYYMEQYESLSGGR